MLQAQEKHSFVEELAALDFVTDGFSWFFMLLTRLAEPLMLLATLYVIAEAGVPSIAVPGLHNLAIGIMITAPELILPGSFVVAKQATEHRRLLFFICFLFVGLTLLTLVSLFVWHLSGTNLAWLMCARCAVAVSYSVLMRVMNHGQAVQSVHKLEQAHAQELDILQQKMNVHIVQLDTAHAVQLDTLIAQHAQELDILRASMTAAHAEQVNTLDAAWKERLEAATRELTTVFQEKLDASKLSRLDAVTPTKTVRRLRVVNGPTIEVDSLDSGQVRDQIHALLREDSTLSARKLAARIGCSPTTAGKWKSTFAQGTS